VPNRPEYGYKDKLKKEIDDFKWQICIGATIKKINNWLKTDKFPNLVSSDKAIYLLGIAEIGTDNKHYIEEFVDPIENTTLEIEIDWPPDGKPNISSIVYSDVENINREIQLNRI
jgi:hypothetical protein